MKTWQIILLIAILITIVLIFMAMRKKPTTTTNATNPKLIMEVNPDMTLRIEDEGQIISLLQTAVNDKLNEYNLFGRVNVDGVFGTETELAIRRLTQGLLSSASGNITLNNVRYKTNW